MDAADGETEQRLVISCAVGEGYIDLLFSDTCGKIQAQQPEADLDSVLADLDAAGAQGLGLAVVKGIVSGRGGRITVDAGPGSTTTFRVRLPVTRIY